uniref:NADH-ubiquinone oxidoreductase chain 2 n=1 Tax=Thyasira tokunagai TaxID=3055801 RepID=A0AB39CC69_9BIVA
MVRLLMVNSCSVLFWGVFLSGICLSVGSMSWLGVWVGMEVSLLGIYGIFCGNFSQNEILASLKYLMIQVLSASMILMGFLFRDWSLGIGILGEFMMMMGVIMKVGIFPFYYWVMPVMSGLSWQSSWIFCTLQKVIPLMVFCVVLEFFVLLSDLCAVMSVMVSGFEGIRQMSMRGIFAYSSIGQSGWLLLLCSHGDSLSLIWFSTIYSFVLMTVFWSLLKNDPYNYKYMASDLSESIFFKGYNVLVVFSLAGIPPLLGFIPKILVLCEVGLSLGIFTLVLLWAVLASVWFYSSFLFSWSVSSSKSFLYLKKMSFFSSLKSGSFFLFFFMNLGGGLLYFLI